MAGIMEWFKINGYNYMYGSLRLDTPVQRLVFVELLALASISRVRRTICLSEGVPYPRPMLAALIGVSEQELNEAILHHSDTDLGRLKINEWCGIEIVKWDKYQSESYTRVQKYRAKIKGCNANVTKDVTLCNTDVTDRIEEKRKEKEEKSRFLEFVFLTKEQHQKLIERFGEKQTTEYIEKLNNGIGSKGYKYKSHYHAILNWTAKDNKINVQTGKIKLYPIAGKNCSSSSCGLPAVYKSTGGDYDNFYCSNHMPDKVKEKYE